MGRSRTNTRALVPLMHPFRTIFHEPPNPSLLLGVSRLNGFSGAGPYLVLNLTVGEGGIWAPELGTMAQGTIAC